MFPDPAQLFVTCSTKKWERAWYIISRDQDIFKKAKFSEHLVCCSTCTHLLPTSYIRVVCCSAPQCTHTHPFYHPFYPDIVHVKLCSKLSALFRTAKLVAAICCMKLRNRARGPLAAGRGVPYFLNQTHSILTHTHTHTLNPLHPHLGVLALSDVLLDRVVPILGVTFVDGEDLTSLGDFHVWVCEDKLANRLG